MGTKRNWLVGAAVAAVGVAMACGGGEGGGSTPPTVTVNEVPDAGVAIDGGGDDAGTNPGTDGGTGDGGTDTGTDAGTMPAAGPWPTEAMINYSDRYGFGHIQSVGVDDAQNIWLLNGAKIGVLRPGTTKAVWVGGIGQAAPGFGQDKLAIDSTVICGGAANRAYVGYRTYDLLMPHREDVNDPEFLKGDLDIVQLNEDGTISLTEHLSNSEGSSQPYPRLPIGIHNSNDWHYDEDRTVLTCQKVMRGRDKGEVYIGTNHGVTRIRGNVYNAHRHPIHIDDTGMYIGYSYGLGIAQNGDVLIANEWKVAILPPPAELGGWEDFGAAPWALDTYNQELNGPTEFDFWRAFQQTTDSKYYLGSSQYGLWEMIRGEWKASANWVKLGGLPTDKINALAATDDGSLFIGTDDSGLWRMDAAKTISKVSGVDGTRVRQLVYDPTVAPAALYVLTDGGLTVMRGH